MEIDDMRIAVIFAIAKKRNYGVDEGHIAFLVQSGLGDSEIISQLEREGPLRFIERAVGLSSSPGSANPIRSIWNGVRKVANIISPR